MPKKHKGPKAEIHAMIVKDTRIRLGCSDFAPDFTLEETRSETTNSNVQNV